jgi:hypothetical protein
MKLMLKLEMPKEPGCNEKIKSIEDTVREAIELVDSGYCSNVEWILLNKLYEKLCCMKKTPRVQNIINMIEPVLAKYGYHKKGIN